MRRCPKCGGRRFIVSAHVVQEWVVDECGLCDEVINDCVCVTHEPSNDDVWQCFDCGFNGAGEMFEVEDVSIRDQSGFAVCFGDLTPEAKNRYCAYFGNDVDDTFIVAVEPTFYIKENKSNE